MHELDREKKDETRPTDKRGYNAPVLTQYGSIEDLVDSGIVGQVPSILLSA